MRSFIGKIAVITGPEIVACCMMIPARKVRTLFRLETLEVETLISALGSEDDNEHPRTAAYI